MKPTTEQMRIAIADVCGWTQHTVSKDDPFTCTRCGTSYNRSIWREWEIPRQWCKKDGKEWPPDYLNDLNAMHEAEKVLTADQWHEYDRLMPLRDPQKTHVTAAQKLKAFLRVMKPEMFE